MFTKINLRQEYNNIRIKEGDKQKTAFLMLECAFEPMVMFFELTNSLATFQIIINDLLRDIINTREVVEFINNIMVETEIEEYDEIVEKVLRKIAKNNSFLKPKKYVQKVKKV